MPTSYDLTQLDTHSFESMVNFLALRVLGNGVTGFATGADGGRDGYLEGTAPYPTTKNQWSGIWYIQSKYHKPSLSGNPQTWLVRQVTEELKLFSKRGRTIPDIWILATNIEPTAVKDTGSFDKIKKLVKSALPDHVNFDIWGGQKILSFLGKDPDVANYYGHFLTPGHVLSGLYNNINDQHTQVKAIIEHLIVNQFNEQTYTKLEQAGSSSSARPKIHELFVDLPFETARKNNDKILNTIVSSAACNHKISCWGTDLERGRLYSKAWRRSRVFILKGGPGQGKSTVGQFYSQIQRASFILSKGGPHVLPALRETAMELKLVAESLSLWTNVPRIPVLIELKDFATWYGGRTEVEPKGILSYLSERIALKTEQKVLTGTVKRAIATDSWFFNFDGLDEVPNDVKDNIADEIIRFSDEVLPSIDADALILCTTRPQGYSGQFDKLDSSTLMLSQLPADIALLCATAVVKFGRTESEGIDAVDTLSNAMQSPQVRELMTTPLQSHIMAVVVRDGGRPPEKRWELFENFYKVMKKRESLKNFKDVRINKLLRDDKLLKAIHARLGIALHAKAESSIGAEATLEKNEFEKLSRDTVTMLADANIEDTLSALMEATTERLVFVNTPDNSDYVRFDIRQLQEFFAGEFIYTDVSPITMRNRMDTICADPHWREVMHFLLSSLVVMGRISELAMAAEVLSSTDNWDGCRFTQIFRRRLSVGAILALRLITEGVLEQDRRVRQTFKNVLVPLYSTLDQSLISALTSVQHTNTKSWLHNCMIDYLFQATEEEQIGAAIVLIRALSDDTDQHERVSNRILKSSSSYINAILKAQLLERPQHLSNVEPSIITQQWFIEGLIDLLDEPNIRIGLNYSLLIKLLHQHYDLTVNSVKYFNLSTVKKSILLAFLNRNEDDADTFSTRQSKRYKGLAFHYFEHDWRTKSIPMVIAFKICSSEKFSPFFQHCASTIVFAQDNTYENLKSFIENMKHISGVEELMPNYLKALLPLDPWRNQALKFADELEKLDIKAYSKFVETAKLSGRNIRPTAQMIAIHGSFSRKGWDDICRDFPYLGSNLSVHARFHSEFDFNDSELNDSITKHAFANPETYASQILHWGSLFEMAGTQAPALRKLLSEIVPKLPTENINIGAFEMRLAPFHINLSEELKLLPTLANALTGTYNSIGVIGKHTDKQTENRTKIDFFAHFGLSIDSLEQIFTDEFAPEIFRQAALSCFLVLGSLTESIDSDQIFNTGYSNIFSQLLNERSPKWYGQSLLKFAAKKLQPNDARSAVLIGELLDFYRDNYSMSLQMQSILSNWRERSVAPVSKAGCLQEWLKQEG
ncbi:hypothetical protein MHB_0031080 [Pseudomonas fluorescens BBc6R8]|uniref:NACHT domain-containing protein n=1 Tax=Pseudomonas fluorescens TaxID=294 RepID=UPI0002D3BA0E|nr:hypothetical protein [Pseudomonas fluorescens]QQD54498.1 hypothetical protein MHB_0031080 [Pseudomonas fluorescens BBc6R8]